jgi:uncharacterized membrane protein YphA (DoxX/SURF4 family)
MNAALWTVQILLAGMFLMASIMKFVMPRQKLASMIKWPADFSDRQVKGIGVLELAAAVGLILPELTGILPIFTPLAAVGLILLMLGAMKTHLRRGEPVMIMVNMVILILAAFVAWGRFTLLS